MRQMQGNASNAKQLVSTVTYTAPPLLLHLSLPYLYPFLPYLTQPAVYLYLLLCRLGLRPSEYGIVRSGPLVVRSSEARNSLPQRGLW